MPEIELAAESGKYEPLFPLLADYWGKPLSELPEALQAKIEDLDLPFDWDEQTPDQRKHLVGQLDYQHNPAHKEEQHRDFIIGFYSIEEAWDMWAGKPTLIAEEAIPLMNGCDPESWRERTTRNGGLPKDMIAAIERGLKIADGEGVKFQSPADWLEWGMKHGLDQPTIKTNERLSRPDVSMWPPFADAVSRCAGNSAESVAKVENTKPGITKGAVINAFEGLYFDRDKWSKYLASPPNWLKECCVTPGRQGSRKSATWNPVLIAVALYDKKISIRKLDAVFVRLHDWAGEWREASASLRD